MQVDPIRPKLIALGIKRLKLEYDDLLSSVSVKFKLRRYTVEDFLGAGGYEMPAVAAVVGGILGRGLHSSTFQLNLSRF